MRLLDKMIPGKKLGIHGKNIDKYIKSIKLSKLKYFDLMKNKRLCPVCESGSIVIRDNGLYAGCSVCGQSFRILEEK